MSLKKSRSWWETIKGDIFSGRLLYHCVVSPLVAACSGQVVRRQLSCSMQVNKEDSTAKCQEWVEDLVVCAPSAWTKRTVFIPRPPPPRARPPSLLPCEVHSHVLPNTRPLKGSVWESSPTSKPNLHHLKSPQVFFSLLSLKTTWNQAIWASRHWLITAAQTFGLPRISSSQLAVLVSLPPTCERMIIMASYLPWRAE